jgi:CheY-like chemotaxis protein
MEGDREVFLAAGMDEYVSKPISLAALLAAMRRALDARAHPRPDSRLSASI